MNKYQSLTFPGIYSLSPYTPEEIVSRNFIVDEKPECVINVIDATNLERNLYLTTQILEIDVPVVIALNMIDAVNKNGDKINTKELSNVLGVPVCEISALKGTGIKELMELAYKTAKTKRTGKTVLADSKVNGLVEEVKNLLVEKNVESPLFHAVKLIEADSEEVKSHKDLISLVDEKKQKLIQVILMVTLKA